MAVVVILPKQGQSVESCIITEIKKKKGDTVKKGDVLFAYETDKASFEEEAPSDGVVLESFYNDGDEVPVLLDMMVIGQPGDDYAGLLQGGSPAVSSEQQAVSIEPVSKTEKTVTPEVAAPTQNSELKTQNSFYTKSGMMLGLGEREEEVLEALRDLRAAGCDILTIGQYLQPSVKLLPVREFVAPEKFAFFKRQAEALCFIHVASGPMVRSSYHADEFAAPSAGG